MDAKAKRTDQPPELVFLGGRVSLDLVDTVGKRGTLDIERLPNAKRFSQWLCEAGLVEHPPRITDEELARMKHLRESLHRLVHAQIERRQPAEADLETVNREAAAPDLVPHMRAAEPGHGTVVSAIFRAPELIDSALSTIARDAIALLCGPMAERVKECEAPDCTIVFLDDSQARRRRWCSMERCGNLAKVAKYRSRGSISAP